MFHLKMKIVTPGARPFEMGRYEDAGYDIFASESKIVYPKTGVLVSTGIATEFPLGFVGLILDRGSTGVKGIMRRAGVVDSGWRDEWRISLYNSGDVPFKIESAIDNGLAKAIAQVVFLNFAKVKPEIVTELSDSERGTNWLGSTDKKGP